MGIIEARLAKRAAQEGVVVGSAICQLIEDASSPDEAVERVANLVKQLRAATPR